MDDIYGPEDIEQLMLSKEFSELYPEEREYVLRHLEGESEYSAMRLMLLDVSSSDDPIAPPARMREDLISMHESSHTRTSFKVWLNSLFAAEVSKVKWRRPAFQLAGLAGIILFITVIYRIMTPDLAQSELAFESRSTEIEIPAPGIEESEVPVIHEEATTSTDEYEQQTRTKEDLNFDRTDDLNVDIAIPDDYSSEVGQAAADLALDVRPELEDKAEIFESDLEENIQISEVLFEDDEVELTQEIPKADKGVMLDGFAVESAKDAVVLDQTEVLSSALSRTSSMSTEVDVPPLNSATVPTELLSLFHTAW